MKPLKNTINLRLKKGLMVLNTVPGSVGAAMLKHADEISKVEDQKDLDDVLKEVHKDVSPEFESDWEDMMQEYDRNKDLFRKYRYIYNFILAGEGLRTMSF